MRESKADGPWDVQDVSKLSVSGASCIARPLPDGKVSGNERHGLVGIIIDWELPFWA